MKNATTIVAVIALVAGLAYWQWRRTGNDTPAAAAIPASLQELARLSGQGLPRAYADGFSIVRVGIDGQRFVSDIRSGDIALADLDPTLLPKIRDQEQQDVIAAACHDPALFAALKRQETIVRRFFDKNGQPIFEVSAVLRHCGRMM